MIKGEFYMNIFITVMDAEIVYAGYYGGKANRIAEEKNHANLLDAAEECGRDIDDLTEYELNEIRVMAGADGYAYTECVEIPDREDYDSDSDYEDALEETYYTDGNDDFTYNEILNSITEAEKQHYENDENYDEDNDYDDDWDLYDEFRDEEDEYDEDNEEDDYEQDDVENENW